MKASLQVRLSQHLALTPQLQQSIRLLQLSTLELHQEIEQMMEQNPFLEPEEETVLPEAQFEGLNASTSASATDSAKSATDADADGRSSNDNVDEPAGVDAAEFGTTERDDWENGTERDDFDGIRELPSSGSGQSGGDDDDFERQNRADAASASRTTCACS
jgi:RNA polymerase sigma-54 factor